MKITLRDPVLLLFSLSVFTISTSLIGGVVSAVVYLVTVLSILYKDGLKPFHGKPLLLLLLFYIVVIIYSAFGRGTLNSLSFKTELYAVISILSCFIFSFHLRKFKTDEIRVLFYVFLVCILFSVIATTYVGFINPMAIRQYGFGSLDESEMSEAMMYQSLGMMSYSLAHSMSVVAMGLCAIICYSHKRWLKIFAFVFLLLVFRLLFIMTITTALVLTCIGVSLIFATYLSRGRVVLAISLVILFVAVFFFAGFASLFLDFSQGVNMNISAKLTDLFSYIETGAGEGQLGYRQELYSASFNTFLHNPLFGWGIDNGSRRVIGEHSFVLDYLAYYGLFAILFFAAWWKGFQIAGSNLSKRLRTSYYFSFIPVVGLLSLKGHSVCSSLPFFSLIFLQIVFFYLDNTNRIGAQTQTNRFRS